MSGAEAARALDALADHAQALVERYPDWRVALKFAPTIRDPHDLLMLCRDHPLMRDDAPWSLTLLPQGPEVAWMRPWLSSRRRQRANYVAASMKPERAGRIAAAGLREAPTPYDLQDWLPHLSGPNPTHFDALLGDPVDGSVGDRWHRYASLQEGEPHRSYVKIPLGAAATDDEIHHTLRLMAHARIRGVSVTSPLKQRFADLPDVIDNVRELPAVNTLSRADEAGDRWLATDTDEVGMAASLQAIEARGVRPGSVAIIGRGGVSFAVRRAIERHPRWSLVAHASARAGWEEADVPRRVTLVVNASGGAESATRWPPRCEAWLDLHYRRVRGLPARGLLHLDGAIFFDAQARAQREFWRDNG